MLIGKKIKQLRLECGLTQEELAQRCELSKGYISQLENELTSPSIATLVDLLTVLGSSLPTFFSEDTEEKVVFSQSDYFTSESAQGNIVTWIVPTSQRNQMEPTITEIAPKSALTPDFPHEGEEFGYVLSGRVKVCVGKFKYSAKAGESFYYRCDREHWLENPGDKPAKVLWVSTPPNF